MSCPAIFSALGDETRLVMLERVIANNPCTVGQACEGLDISRQGARKHLQILINADLIESKPEGRTVLLVAKKETIEEASNYLQNIEKYWQGKLGRLKEHLESQQP